MKYLLDANVFIQAHNAYYGMDFCPGYWEWLLKAHAKGLVVSIKKVYDELQNGNEDKDDLKKWSKKHPELFALREDELSIQEYFPNVLEAIPQKFNDKKRSDFQDGADPWLIATAKTKNLTLVTQEHLDLKCKKKILIPNMCEILGVAYMNAFEMLRENQAKLVL